MQHTAELADNIVVTPSEAGNQRYNDYNWILLCILQSKKHVWRTDILVKQTTVALDTGSSGRLHNKLCLLELNDSHESCYWI